MSSHQAQIVLTATDADVAVEQLEFVQRFLGDGQIEVLKKALNDAIAIIKKLRGEAVADLETAVDPKSLVLYAYDNNPPVNNLEACTARMRVGKVRKIDRLVVAEPLYAVCVGATGVDWVNRFRIVDSEQAAKAVKVLHNV